MTVQDAFAEGVTVRRLPPATRRRNELPRWEVCAGATVIGRIEERHFRRASAVFYFATGIHPVTGKEYRLEGSTDFDERVQVVHRFHLDPMSSRQHLGLHSWTQTSTTQHST